MKLRPETTTATAIVGVVVVATEVPVDRTTGMPVISADRVEELGMVVVALFLTAGVAAAVVSVTDRDAAATGREKWLESTTCPSASESAKIPDALAFCASIRNRR